MNSKSRISLFVLALLVVVAGLATADQFNERDQNILVFPIGDVAGDASAVTPFTVRIPQAIKIDAAYFVNNGAITKDGTNYFEAKVLEDGVAMGVFTSSDTSVVDDTPVALTVSDSSADAGSLISATITAVASSPALTDCAIMIHYHNAN